jgi:chaperonin GroEL
MIKTHLITDDTLDRVFRGAEKLYKAVSVTMGPRGRNVIFRKAGGRTGVTHDGVTVAKAVKLSDPTEDVAADLLKEAAAKLDATTGDGTTTVTVLTYHILKAAIDYVKEGVNPMKIRLALDEDVVKVVKQIEALADKDVKKDTLVAVATVASGSPEIGKEVGEIVHEAGASTPVLLGFSDSAETYTEVIKGFKIDAGPASPYLMEGAGVRQELKDPYIIVCDAKLRDKDDVLPLLRLIATIDPEKRKFLLVTSEIAGDALSLMVVNHLKGFAGVTVARIPPTIGSPTEYLTDIAMSTGAKLLSRNSGHTISQPSLEHFGSADKVVVEPNETVIVGGRSIGEDLNAHLASLRTLADKGKSASARKFAEDRILTLEQKVLSIRVGGQSEADAEERHYRYEDAVGASRSALRHGVVPGGGTMLYDIGKDHDNPVLKDALTAPLKLVMSNAGLDTKDFPNISHGHGVDVLHPEDGVINLTERGVLDPVESEIEAVKTAVTIAGLLLTSGAMIVDEVTNEKAPEQFSLS